MTRIAAAVVFALSLAAPATGDPVWVVDPQAEEPDSPPVGRSLFDHLVGASGRYDVPFPLEALIERIEQRLSRNAYLDRPLKKVLIPLGRSLQRDAAAPAYFASPRAVVAVDGEPLGKPAEATMLLRDRLYLGYMEAAAVLEVISYNEAAGRFEFQVVRDYRQDGEKRVVYAPRRLCRACHQNAAPIFARPLWDETNANAAVARLLHKQGRDFYGIPLHQTVDVAYAIDNATDRANEFALTQYLWRSGCGAGAPGSRCRGALFLAALQAALSAARDFDQTFRGAAAAVLRPFESAGTGRWPDGLLRVDADIPNRSPVREILSNLSDDIVRFGFASDIHARFEPLSPRAPKSSWQPTPAAAVTTAVTGLTEFFSAADIEELSKFLDSQPAAQHHLSVACQLRDKTRAAKRVLKFSCSAPEITINGRLYQSGGDQFDGRLALFELRDDTVTGLQLKGQREGERLLLRPYTSSQGLKVRLRTGDAIDTLAFGLEGGRTTDGYLIVTLRNDFTAVSSAVDRLVQQRHDAFSDRPFRRAVTLKALFEALRMDPREWCCIQDRALPPVHVERPDSADILPGAAPFFKACAACHRSSTRFPPNFLAGPVDEARSRLAYCGERIKYRLGMWLIGPELRGKTPMPPQHAVADLGLDHQSWTESALYQSLQQTLDAIALDSGQALPSLEQLLTRDYHTLRACLPNA